jgi:hypothetical protein
MRNTKELGKISWFSLQLLIVLAMVMISCKHKKSEELMANYTVPEKIDLTDPNSIVKWEQSEWNVLKSKIKVTKLEYFGGRLKRKDEGKAILIGVQMRGALSEGILPAQEKALKELVDNEEEVHGKVREAIYKYYNQSYQDYKKGFEIAQALYGIRDYTALLPKVVRGDELDDIVEFQEMLVHPPKDGHSKIGIEFNCSWDEEHGLGVVVCDGEVEQAGMAEVAILPF